MSLERRESDMYIFSAILFLVGLLSVPMALACVYASHGLLERKDGSLNFTHITVWLCTTPLPAICFIGMAECLLNGSFYVGCFGAILAMVDAAIIAPLLISKEM